MTKQAYYKHLRSLGNFPAMESWRLASEAAALDAACAARRVAARGPSAISHESQDGAQTLRLTSSVFCF